MTSVFRSKLLLGEGELNQEGFGGMLPENNFAFPKPRKSIYFPCFLRGIFANCEFLAFQNSRFCITFYNFISFFSNNVCSVPIISVNELVLFLLLYTQYQCNNFEQNCCAWEIAPSSLSDRGGQQLFTYCPAGYIAFI